MQLKAKYGLVFITFIVYIQLLLLIYHRNSSAEIGTIKNDVVIATVVCGSDLINETLVMVKSAIYFSKIKLKFIIFADDIANNSLQLGIESMRKFQMKRAVSHDFEIHPISFPNNDPDISETKWRNIFRPCSCQRLFLPVSFKFCLKIKNDCCFIILKYNKRCLLKRVCCLTLIPSCTWIPIVFSWHHQKYFGISLRK